MYISDYKLMDILREKMGEEEARTLVEYIEYRVEDKFIQAERVFATKEDLLKLELKIQETAHKYHLETQQLIAETRAHSEKFFAELKNDTQKLIAESKNDTQKMFIDVQKQIADSKVETLKWMFTMMLTSTIAIIGTILTVMKMGGW